MSDSLVVADASQALVLADAAQAEQSLVLVDDSGDTKRKAKWTRGGVSKKGKRWGLLEDKPFKPLPYVELPVGWAEAEVDQFLREQRLEDLNRKIQLGQLEDVEPDIRPPSPPPIYDRQGNRLNTREIRIRKAMLAEWNRLIRYMLKNLNDYVPPEGWKPQRLVKKILIPYEKYPNASFMGVIIGARGVNHKRLQEATGCRIFIRGKDIGDKFQQDEERHMPQHVHIEGETEEQIETATELIMPLLNPESPEFEYARTHGMQQVALVNGFTLKKTEQRCGVCGAVGHLGFDCPETEAFSYKMADVKCTICGDRGHVASDCKQAAEKHQKENVDWKVEAEKKRELDEEYEKMMSELGLSKAKPQATPQTPAHQAEDGELDTPAADDLQPSPQEEAQVPSPLAELSTKAVPPVQPQDSLPPGLVARGTQVKAPPPPLPPNALPKVPPPPRPRGLQPAPGADTSITCPRALSQRLFKGGLRVLREMGHETRARVTIHDRPDSEGGPFFAISGSPEAREMAKLHVRAWLDVNSRSDFPEGNLTMSSPAVSVQPFDGAGFPPGFPSFPGDVPPGFPPHGFPPVMPSFPPAGFPPGFPPGGPGPMDPMAPMAPMAQARAASPPQGMSVEAYEEI
ncbi:Splicing factor-like protein 1 (AtSF1) (SF1 homolog protein) [Durusdinium trenchii]|uniref:Branchpoint-bridging protein n=2 Tax=Durusdinium trenchii TaxID=1381693 RepID=A0ABP0JQD2_9DINO